MEYSGKSQPVTMGCSCDHDGPAHGDLCQTLDGDKPRYSRMRKSGGARGQGVATSVEDDERVRGVAR